MKIPVYNIEGKEVEKMEVSESVFGVKKNDDLIHQVMVAIEANGRQVLAHTKNRGERAGSGIKPWRQKGTGRARVGSVRNPAWRKGGVAFGPRKDRNFSKKINKKMNSKAILMVLSAKLKDEELIILDKLNLAVKKTKAMAEVLKNLKINKKTLVAFCEAEKDLRITSRNIKKVENIMVGQLNVADMLKNKFLLLTKESIAYLEGKYNKQ
ncbi:MAG: 50S ribosomal protein L4 [Candidatus Moranbacteria bacterium RIFOXYA12_FULL_35_19]|nr:MAG: 50S ribosomal protein L4 [Candidatus Moranbacteria bacterium GW2011_GWF2_35_39]OGI31348.1 MAG: 50S ribosomal protein L4 [Candidatus Moranbacteria bacterium RIFOXYB12_FULL_35_8]OGI32808.1 MAG: 50S ribosomal protein L4 [Candidatus Moranbacteria bacterium RIFOXYC12_FULL_36_13]OGI36136.1 MAG: 50S ribosomal protein L4 [Candidatus Moranbacteria bacterium RIFOXYA12_FULL_35_19]